MSNQHDAISELAARVERIERGLTRLCSALDAEPATAIDYRQFSWESADCPHPRTSRDASGAVVCDACGEEITRG